MVDTMEHRARPGKREGPAICSGAFESRHRRDTTRSGIGDQGRLGAEERTRTSTGLPPPDPESGVSTNSTTSAGRQKARAMYSKHPGKSRRWKDPRWLRLRGSACKPARAYLPARG